MVINEVHEGGTRKITLDPRSPRRNVQIKSVHLINASPIALILPVVVGFHYEYHRQSRIKMIKVKVSREILYCVVIIGPVFYISFILFYSKISFSFFFIAVFFQYGLSKFQVRVCMAFSTNKKAKRA